MMDEIRTPAGLALSDVQDIDASFAEAHRALFPDWPLPETPACFNPQLFARIIGLLVEVEDGIGTKDQISASIAFDAVREIKSALLGHLPTTDTNKDRVLNARAERAMDGLVKLFGSPEGK